jgi:hypothetical protein
VSWKTELRLVDLDDHTQIECTCRKCGHMRHEDSTDLVAQEGFAQLHIHEVEECLSCSERSCPGPISIALVGKDTHDLTTD